MDPKLASRARWISTPISQVPVLTCRATRYIHGSGTCSLSFKDSVNEFKAQPLRAYPRYQGAIDR